MKIVRVACCLACALLAAAPAWAQFGLYGSPEILRLPPPQPATSYGTYGAPAAAPLTAGPSYAAPYGSGAIRPAVASAPTEAPSEAPSLIEADQPPAAPAPADQPSVVEQMLGPEPVDAGPAGGEGCYSGPVECFEEQACGDCLPDYCRCPWFASAMWITMGRDEANRVWTSYQWGNEANQLYNTQDVDLRFHNGVEVHVGRRFCCDQWALEGVYWFLDRQTREATFGGPLSTPLTVGHVEFNGVGANAWFDNAAAHRLRRTNDFQNVEINLIRNRLYGQWDSPWGVDWLVGVRYFRFEERLIFGALQNNSVWGEDGGAVEAYFDDKVVNHLVGFQFGFNADWRVVDGVRLFVTPKLGIYNNHIHQDFQAYLGDGTIATTGSSGVAGTYPVVSSTNHFSFLGQIDVGVDWRFLPRWSLQGGYRLIAVTGVGLADNQFPPYLVDIPEIAAIDTNGDLILHGAFAGLTFNY
jgi:hypothetical protein